jgi:HAD superfamily hydrolase (TIGR01509 family)
MSDARRFDAVVFDMDGVLVDSEAMHFAVTRRVLAECGVRYEETDEFLGCTDLEMYQVLVPRYRLPHDAASLAERQVAMTVEHAALVRPMPGVPAVPRTVARHGYRIAVASSASPEIIAAQLGAVGLADDFEHLVSGVEVPRSKPAPDVFLEAARRLGVAPHRCLVVEDSRNGMLAAKAAGMACAVVPCGATRRQYFGGADWRFASLAGVAALLRCGSPEG